MNGPDLTGCRVLYKPKGKALEYAGVALSVYSGCPGGCWYCYVPAILHRTRQDFHGSAVARPQLLRDLCYDLTRLRGDLGMVHMCFTCDPYPAVESGYGLTRSVIETLGVRGFRVQVLTKRPSLASRDFDLLGRFHGSLGITLTYRDGPESIRMEPGCDTPECRLSVLEAACKARLYTWVSAEPVVNCQYTREMVHEALDRGVREVRVGPLNYNVRPYTAKEFALMIVDLCALCAEHHAKLVIKEECEKLMDEAAGLMHGTERKA